MPTTSEAARDGDEKLVVIFKNYAVKNEARTASEGRPIHDDVEMCEIHYPGRRDWQPFPATAFSRWITDPITGEQMQETYAERFAKQYAQFKARQAQTVSGTPLDHAPFLTEGQRATMRALKVYTVEQLADMDGQDLKNLGPGGRDWKNRALEYLSEAKSKAPATQLLAELDTMRARMAQLEEDNEQLKQRAVSSANGEGDFAEMSDEQVREYIKSKLGHAPQGNIPRKQLVRMAQDATPRQPLKATG